MISLGVESYCVDCPEFEADVEKENENIYVDCVDGTCRCVNGVRTTIRCRNRHRCSALYKYLKENGKNHEAS